MVRRRGDAQIREVCSGEERELKYTQILGINSQLGGRRRRLTIAGVLGVWRGRFVYFALVVVEFKPFRRAALYVVSGGSNSCSYPSYRARLPGRRPNVQHNRYRYSKPSLPDTDTVRLRNNTGGIGVGCFCEAYWGNAL